MFRAEPADFNFDISGHNWFSDEHFWTSMIQRWTLLASSKQAKTMKKAKTSVFFNIDAEETRNRKIPKNFSWVILKNSKNVIFPKSVFSFDSMSEDFLLEQKKGEKYQNSSCNREKNVTGVNFDVFTVFFGKHVKSLRQQFSWQDQKKSVMFRAQSVFFRIHQSLFDGAE